MNSSYIDQCTAFAYWYPDLREGRSKSASREHIFNHCNQHQELRAEREDRSISENRRRKIGEPRFEPRPRFWKAGDKVTRPKAMFVDPVSSGLIGRDGLQLTLIMAQITNRSLGSYKSRHQGSILLSNHNRPRCPRCNVSVYELSKLA